MKALKIIAILAIVYVGIVAVFESLLGYFQPTSEGTLVITTTDGGGSTSDRVLSRIDIEGQLYVAANHWPRAWYNNALENPNVQVTIDGEKGDYLAVAVTGAEHDRVISQNQVGPLFRFLMGYPPRYFVRLDPR